MKELGLTQSGVKPTLIERLTQAGYQEVAEPSGAAIAKLWEAMRALSGKPENEWKTDLEKFPQGRQLGGATFFAASVIKKAVELITD